MLKPVEAQIDFPQMEKNWIKKWYERGLVEKYLSNNNSSSKRFSFLDGPITANNPMGVHHAWGRTYKDLWQRFYNLLGFRQRFQNGFDCQGLWVEVEVEKELGTKTKHDIENLVPGDKKASIAKFVEMCKQRVVKFAGIQTDQSKRLGYFMDWDNSYFTMSPENNYMIWHFLKRCYENGWIYKGHDSVPWCPRCETAISQHEMLTEDYKEVVHETVIFRLPVLNPEVVGKQYENRKIYLLVWTTTPWTIPANVAVGINTKFQYALWENPESNDLYVLLTKGEAGRSVPPRDTMKIPRLSLEEWVMTNADSTRDYKRIEIRSTGTILTNDQLLNLTYTAPFDELDRVQKAKSQNSEVFHTVIDASDIVVDTEGTGLLHVAPGAGQEDFQLGKKYKLPLISVINDNATYLEGMGELSSQNAKKHPELIIEYLRHSDKKQYLFKTMNYRHRYPACWRCKTELVWKVADEWYIAMDKKGKASSAKREAHNKTLRERMMEVAKKIVWMPSFGLDRELDWLKNMHDWLISKKKRYWGLALPIYECKACGAFEVLGGYEELKARAAAGWDQFEGKTPHKPFIDAVTIRCKKCGDPVSRIDDVGNPWLDAGIVPFSTLIDPKTKQLSYITDKTYFQEWFPADFITESFPGQFKNWFYALIAMATVLENTNPYKTVLGFGTLLGEDGRPMHKSWGNAIEFNEGADKIGVDVMRWMYARQNPADNMLFGYKKADEVRRQFYLILWNSYKFFVDYALQDKFSAKREALSVQNIKNVLDLWIISRFVMVVKMVEESLKNYNARDAAVEIERFVNDFSTWYIRRSRERVGVNSEDLEDKNALYSTSYWILKNLSIILSPFMPFISEEMYTNLSQEKESVHLEIWPDTSKIKKDDSLLTDMELVREIVEAGHKARKDSNLKVRQPLALTTMYLSDGKSFTKKEALRQYEKLIMNELNVKKVVWKKGSGDTIVLTYDTHLTEELRLEGELRELLRAIQQERKAKNVKVTDRISLTVPQKFEPFADEIKKKVLAKTIAFEDTMKVE